MRALFILRMLSGIPNLSIVKYLRAVIHAAKNLARFQTM